MISLGHVSANCSLNYFEKIDVRIFSDFYSFVARNEWGPESRGTPLQTTHVNLYVDSHQRVMFKKKISIFAHVIIIL